MRPKSLFLQIQPRIKLGLYRAPFYLPLITLALLGVAFNYAWTQPYDGLEWSRITYEVEKVDGPAIEADLHVGDVILQLDGAPIKEVHPLYGSKKAGERVFFTVLRCNPSWSPSASGSSVPSFWL